MVGSHLMALYGFRGGTRRNPLKAFSLLLGGFYIYQRGDGRWTKPGDAFRRGLRDVRCNVPFYLYLRGYSNVMKRYDSY